MKRAVIASVAGLASGLVLLLNSGCDWSSGGGTNAFNTSQGAGININFSGFYNGEFPGGRAVQDTTSGNINNFTISQVGNSLTVVDNQGSVYKGSVGSPGLVSSPVNGVYPAGAELVQSQISWAGKDGVSARDIEFVGVIHVVSVIDIEQEIDSSSDTRVGSKTSSTTSTVRDDGTTEIVIIEVDGDKTTTTTIIQETLTGQTLSSTVTTTSNDSSSSFDGFQITEANSQYRLEGTWVEVGGKVSGVKARSAGSAGLITVEGDETDTDLEDVDTP